MNDTEDIVIKKGANLLSKNYITFEDRKGK